RKCGYIGHRKDLLNLQTDSGIRGIPYDRARWNDLPTIRATSNRPWLKEAAAIVGLSGSNILTFCEQHQTARRIAARPIRRLTAYDRDVRTPRGPHASSPRFVFILATDAYRLIAKSERPLNSFGEALGPTQHEFRVPLCVDGFLQQLDASQHDV